MHQTGYKGLQNITRIKQAYIGGICKWWYVPIEDIAAFPAVNPLTQLLGDAILLKDGCNWYGPVKVPDPQLGWTETMAITKGGLYYQEKVTGFIPGHSADSHINIENLSYYQVCIIAKRRSVDFCIVLGNDVTGLNLTTDNTSGLGSFDTPGTKISFGGEQIQAALILPSKFFQLDLNTIITEDGFDIITEDGRTLNPG